jgi:hypothetical protein
MLVCAGVVPKQFSPERLTRLPGGLASSLGTKPLVWFPPARGGRGSARLGGGRALPVLAHGRVRCLIQRRQYQKDQTDFHMKPIRLRTLHGATVAPAINLPKQELLKTSLASAMR